MSTIGRSVIVNRKSTMRKIASMLRHTAPIVRTSLSRIWNGASGSENSYRLDVKQCNEYVVAYRSPSTDEKVIQNSFENDRFFATVPEYVPQEDDVILDVGAHIGTFAMLASRRIPQGTVYAIEPCRETYNYLRVNISLNRTSNLRPFNLALADYQGHARLSYSQGHWGNSIMLDRSLGGETVPTQTLSEFFEENQIDRCAFAKFNCEGAEFPVLISSPEETLRRIHWMLILYHCDLAKSYRSEDLEQHLLRCGFTTSIRKKSTNRGWLVAERIGDGPTHAAAPE
jgi:FkbM family methyltransferase